MMSSLALSDWSENAKELTWWNYIWLCIESPEFLPFVIKSAKDVTFGAECLNYWLVTISWICRVLHFGKLWPVKVKNSTIREGLFILSTPFRSSNKQYQHQYRITFGRTTVLYSSRPPWRLWLEQLLPDNIVMTTSLNSPQKGIKGYVAP